MLPWTGTPDLFPEVNAALPKHLSRNWPTGLPAIYESRRVSVCDQTTWLIVLSQKFSSFSRWQFRSMFNHYSLVQYRKYYPGQIKEPSSRFAARRTLFHVWCHARSRAISTGQKSRTVADRTLPCADRLWSSMISHVEQRSSRRESRRWFFFLARVVLAHAYDQQRYVWWNCYLAKSSILGPRVVIRGWVMVWHEILYQWPSNTLS